MGPGGDGLRSADRHWLPMVLRGTKSFIPPAAPPGIPIFRYRQPACLWLWIRPSIARNDAAYSEQNYWRGRVWAPLNFLVYLALARTELEDVRRDLAEKSAVLFMKEWTEHRHVHENYNSITGEGCDSGNSDKFYHWGALLCAVALADAGYIKNLGKPLEE